jgi:hypothetical protein
MDCFQIWIRFTITATHKLNAAVIVSHSVRVRPGRTSSALDRPRHHDLPHEK